MVIEAMAQTGKEPTFCMGNVAWPPWKSGKMHRFYAQGCKHYVILIRIVFLVSLGVPDYHFWPCMLQPINFFGRFRCHLYPAPAFRREGQTLGSAVEQGSDTWRLFVPWAPGDFPKRVCWVLAWVDLVLHFWDSCSVNSYRCTSSMFKFDSMGKSCAARSEEMFHPQSSRNDNREAHVLYDYFTQRFAQAMNWPAVLGETCWSWGWSYWHTRRPPNP